MRLAPTSVLLLALAAGCGPADAPPDADAMDPDLHAFATRYTAAWNSEDAASVAAFFAEGGSLTVNDGAPAVGREAIAEVAQGFMTAFPDMVIAMDSLHAGDAGPEYHWTLTGTHAETGNAVRISGFETWTLAPDGLVAASLGAFDADDYQRQLEASPEAGGPAL